MNSKTPDITVESWSGRDRRPWVFRPSLAHTRTDLLATRKSGSLSFRKISDLRAARMGLTASCDETTNETFGLNLLFISYASRWMARVGIRKKRPDSLIMDLTCLGNSRKESDEYDTVLAYLREQRLKHLRELEPNQLSSVMQVVEQETKNATHLGVLSGSTDTVQMLKNFDLRDRRITAMLNLATTQQQELTRLKNCNMELSLKVERMSREQEMVEESRDKCRQVDAEISFLKQRQISEAASFSHADQQLRKIHDAIKKCLSAAGTLNTVQTDDDNSTAIEKRVEICESDAKAMENLVDKLILVSEYRQQPETVSGRQRGRSVFSYGESCEGGRGSRLPSVRVIAPFSGMRRESNDSVASALLTSAQLRTQVAAEMAGFRSQKDSAHSGTFSQVSSSTAANHRQPHRPSDSSLIPQSIPSRPGRSSLASKQRQ